MNIRYSILVATCFVALLTLAFAAFNSDTTARASAPNAKPTATISKNMNAGRVGNAQVAITPEANKLLPLNANAQFPSSVIPNTVWSLSGNAGTSPGLNFIGTTDNQALLIGVNAQRALRIEPDPLGPNIIGGHNGNFVTAGLHGATIAGGGSVVSPNNVTANQGTIGGGDNNIVSGGGGTIAGGDSNRASDLYATVGGGLSNTASNNASTVAGGNENTASGLIATVGGGYSNIASGNRATVPGGDSNQAAGDYSFAAGRRAKLASTADGSFMFADSNDFNFNSNLANAFRVRVTGGAKFVVAINGSGDPTAWCELTDGTGWDCSSDRNIKENFQVVNARALLEKLVRLPVVKWNAKGHDPRAKHLGPMAQDFYAAFGLGDDDKSISTIDLDGVALVSIQALYEMLRAQETELNALRAENVKLKQALNSLDARITALEQQQSK